MRLFTANGAHMSRMGSVSAWSSVVVARRAHDLSEALPTTNSGPAPSASSAEEVYYGAETGGLLGTTGYPEKP